MKTRHRAELLWLFVLMALPAAPRAADNFSPPSRTFQFAYQVTLKDIPSGASRVRVWIPLAVTDPNQTVILRKVDGPVHLRETHEAAFANHILYGEILQPHPGPVEFTVEYEVTRKEYSRGDYKALEAASNGSATAPKNLARFLEPDRPGSYRWQDQGTGGR